MDQSENRYCLDLLPVLREVVKNILMGIPGLKNIRTHLGKGRTTGGMRASEAIEYAQQTVDIYLHRYSQLSMDGELFAGKRVLEIGTGANLLVAKLILSQGAKNVVTIDRFKDLRESAFSNKALFGKEVLHSNIIYHGGCAIETVTELLDERFDVIVSHLTLEHAINLSMAINNIAKLLAPKGITIHICNLRSLGGVPGYKRNPLKLLTYSPLVWKLMFGNRGGSNRHRINYYKEKFAANGLSVRKIVVLDKISHGEVERIRPAIDPEFNQLDDETLSIIKFAIIGIKQ